jgi:hypothetical protein
LWGISAMAVARYLLMLRKSTIWPDDWSFFIKGWKTSGIESRGGVDGSAGDSAVSSAPDKVEGLGFWFGRNDEWVRRTVMPSDCWAPRRLLSTDVISGAVLVSNEEDLQLRVN